MKEQKYNGWTNYESFESTYKELKLSNSLCI